jgi:hypothetical protein
MLSEADCKGIGPTLGIAAKAKGRFEKPHAVAHDQGPSDLLGQLMDRPRTTWECSMIEAGKIWAWTAAVATEHNGFSVRAMIARAEAEGKAVASMETYPFGLLGDALRPSPAPAPN